LVENQCTVSPDDRWIYFPQQITEADIWLSTLED